MDKASNVKDFTYLPEKPHCGLKIPRSSLFVNKNWRGLVYKDAIARPGDPPAHLSILRHSPVRQQVNTTIAVLFRPFDEKNEK